MTFNPHTPQIECPECAQLFEGPGRNRHLDEHLDREHVGDDSLNEWNARKLEEEKAHLATLDEYTDHDHGGCDAGDPCPHPNLQALRSGGPAFLTTSPDDPEPPAERPDWNPLR